MVVSIDSIEYKIISGPDRMALSNALFNTDGADEPERVVFRLEEPPNRMVTISVTLNEMVREPGGQTTRWRFRGTVSQQSVQKKIGYGVSGHVSGYYNLETGKGCIRLRRI